MNGSYSYHIFYFPFKWEIPERKDLLFSKQVDLVKIKTDQSFWERVTLSDDNETVSDFSVSKEERESLFAEQNYYFEFVHPALYDTGGEHPLLLHFERKEPRGGKVSYVICTHGRQYVLKVDAINLNLYSTGVGILSFFLENEDERQLSPDDIRQINQYGRRIMPHHYGEISSDRRQLADFLALIGLNGLDDDYYEDFRSYRTTDCWKPAKFILSLIRDLSPELEVTSVIDDRMFVNCSYLNNELSDQVKKTEQLFVEGDFWYRYAFMDEDSETCQNDEMKKRLLEACTYKRWQKWGSLYAVTRYSVVLLSSSEWFPRNILITHMRTLYSKMVELVLVQQASMLRFSGEVTKVSRLSGSEDRLIADRISSLYKEYIRFVNQVYFRTVTAQDQGIELYDLFFRQLNSAEQNKDLDEEISELHQYYSVLTEKKRNENGEYLNRIATICLPATIIAGVFGMNSLTERGGFDSGSFWLEVVIIIVLSVTSAGVLLKLLRKK